MTMTCTAKLALGLSLLGTVALVAHAADGGMPTEFPPQAEALAAAPLAEALKDKVFKGALADGVGLRYQFKGHYVYLNTSKGYASTGTWRTDDGTLCTDFPAPIGANCVSARVLAGALYYKRLTTGEVVTLAVD